MTDRLEGSDPAALTAEAVDLEAAINRLGTADGAADPATRDELEQRVVRLCAAAQALPGTEARSLADTLTGLIAALDRAAERLRAGIGTGDSVPDAGTARRAAAAYGGAASRRRRGF